MLRGKSEHLTLPSNATVRALASTLRERCGVKPSRLRIVTASGCTCEDEAGLLGLTDCPLKDLLDPKILRRVTLEVELQLVVCSDACFVCDTPSARRCSGCMLTRYCSRECQSKDWAQHREQCCRIQSRLSV